MPGFLFTISLYSTELILIQIKSGTKSAVHLYLLLPWHVNLSNWHPRISPEKPAYHHGQCKVGPQDTVHDGKISQGHAFCSSTGIWFYLSFVFLVSFCTNTACSASSRWNRICRQARGRTLSPKVSDRVHQAATALIKQYVSGLKRVLSSIISLSGMTFDKFCRLDTRRYHNGQVSHTCTATSSLFMASLTLICLNCICGMLQKFTFLG